MAVLPHLPNLFLTTLGHHIVGCHMEPLPSYLSIPDPPKQKGAPKTKAVAKLISSLKYAYLQRCCLAWLEVEWNWIQGEIFFKAFLTGETPAAQPLLLKPRQKSTLPSPVLKPYQALNHRAGINT